MKTLIFLLLIFCLMCSLVSSAQQKTPPFTGMRNTAAALVFYDKGTEIGRFTDTNLTGKDSTGTVFIKNVRGWYIADSVRAWPVLTRITELYLNIKHEN